MPSRGRLRPSHRPLSHLSFPGARPPLRARCVLFHRNHLRARCVLFHRNHLRAKCGQLRYKLRRRRLRHRNPSLFRNLLRRSPSLLRSSQLRQRR